MSSFPSNPWSPDVQTQYSNKCSSTRSALLKNLLVTPSSELQDATVAECLPLLNGLNNPLENPSDYDERGIREFEREAHVAFAEGALDTFPAPFVGIDASRPWMIYWALTALHFLGEDITAYCDRITKTFFPLQNPTGGYGGGQGHTSHLAGTYATILCLAMAGREGAYELTDRKAMWQWLGRLKEANGGFQICEGGENDTRAAYCALLVIALLNLPWNLPSDCPVKEHGFETFGDGLGEFISRCQTYEGGIASAPGGEAHGAYTFCALAALCLLGDPQVTIPKYLNIDLLLSWLSSRQYAPEGGFAGRTNKVVDGCYSQWIGGCFPLVQAALTGPESSKLDSDVGDLYSTEGLSRYILNCCQGPDGGLRDKPSKHPDSYHTCYTLAGLSNGEHYHYYTTTESSLQEPANVNESQFSSAFTWKSSTNQQRETITKTADSGSQNHWSRFQSGCKLAAVHPVFVIPHHAVLGMRTWSLQQQEIQRSGD